MKIPAKGRKIRAWSLTLFLIASVLTGTAQKIITEKQVKTGAAQTSLYLPMLQGKKVGVVANHTSLIGKTHLVDSLMALGVNIKTVFAPEHGFRGTADAGEHVNSGIDKKTGLPLISLYGRNKKPGKEQLANIDIVVFDIQDVGARFYTYISTLTYVMEACADAGIPVLVLDRPNPNGHYFDGPVLDTAYSSFVGLHPVPVVHGMTVAEYAQMVNGEGWLKSSKKCELSVIRCIGYSHRDYFQIEVGPSPNLSTMNSIYLYPSICFFEGTPVSVGRGTTKPFEQIGYPEYPGKAFSFTPKSGPGSKNPPFEGKVCWGINLENEGLRVRDEKKLRLHWLIEMYKSSGKKEAFFQPFFDKLAGTDKLKKAIIAGQTEEQIRDSWKEELERYGKMRAKYLLYAD